MGIDVSKLEKVKHRDNYIIARCPACAIEDRDRKGEHLFIYKNGRFGCVIYPGNLGKIHRQRIFELVGIKNMQRNQLFIKDMPIKQKILPQIIKKDILGQLGRVNLASTRIEKSHSKCELLHLDKDSQVIVPNDIKVNYTLKEITLLHDVDIESLRKIHTIKQIFRGNVINVD